MKSFTDALQQDRLIVVAVDKARSRLRLKDDSDACTDLSCPEQTLVVSDEGTSADLDALNPGDIVKIEGASSGPRRIVVVRRVWDELGSPEW